MRELKLGLMRKMFPIVLAFILLPAGQIFAGSISADWTVTADPAVTEDAQAVLEHAMKSWEDVAYNPIYLLAVQEDAGTNYCFLCREAEGYPEMEKGYYLVYIHEDPDGTAYLLDDRMISFGVSDVYHITISPDTEDYMVYQCPASARAGDTVVVEIAFVTDADTYVSINGDTNYGSFSAEGYTFVMPEEDVEIKVWAVGNGLA